MINIYVHSPSHMSAVFLHLPSIYFLLKGDYARFGNQQLNWIPPMLYERPADQCLEYLQSFGSLDYFVMSVYNWNEDHMIELAKHVKKIWPKCIIIAGGYQVTKAWAEYEFIDRVILGDPEGIFHKIIDEINTEPVVENYIQSFEYSAILDHREELIAMIEEAKNQFNNLDVVYVWETNRGCPYSCVFCNWGYASRTKLKVKPLNMVLDELNVLLKTPIDILRIADANFGILKQDEIIADYIIANKPSHLKDIDMSWAKNNKETAFRVAKKLQDANLIKRFKYGLQDIHEDVGIAIKRPEKKQWFENLNAFKESKIKVPLRLDLIIGLPEQTKLGYFTQMQKFIDLALDIPNVPLLQILPNTPLTDKDYLELYQLKHRKTREVSMPGYIEPSHRSIYGNYGVDYKVDTVVSNSTLSNTDIYEMVIFSGVVQALYQGGIIDHKINYIDLYENFIKNPKYPFINILYENHISFIQENPNDSPVNIPLFDIEENIRPHSGAYFYTNILLRSDVFQEEFGDYSGLKINKNIITFQNTKFESVINFVFKIGWKTQLQPLLR